MIQTCEALQYAHTATAQDGKELNIVHRDLDLRNLMIDRHGYIKIIDFGVAKASTQLEITAPTIFKGKLSYSAPEAFVEPTVDHRADLYALGLVFRQLVTGQKPFKFGRDANVGLIVQTISRETLPPATTLNKDLPPEINALLDKATEKNRERRFQSATDMANAITNFADKSGNGIANPGEIREWFQKEFADRIKQRKAFEQEVLEKARILAAKVAAGELEEDDSIIPSPGEGKEPSPPKESSPPSVPTRKEIIPRDVPLRNDTDVPVRNHTDALIPGPIATANDGAVSDFSLPPDEGAKKIVDPTMSGNATPETSTFPAPGTSSLTDRSMSLESLPPASLYPDLPVYKRVNPYILLGVIFAMLLAGALVFQQLFWKPPKMVPAVAEKPLGAVNLRIISIPKQADVYINEKKVGTTGVDGLKMRVTSGQMHAIRIEKEGYDVYKTVVWGKPASLQVTKATLVESPVNRGLTPTEQDEAKVEKTAADQPSKKVSKPKKSKNPTVLVSKEQDEKVPPADKPTEETNEPAPEITWISKTGDWNGAQVASSGCLTCHKGGILLMSKTRDEWQRFLLQGQHNRHKNLNQYFSKRELARVLAYILRKIDLRKEAEKE
jgi:serine/threonine protein kinase/cytochrome c5